MRTPDYVVAVLAKAEAGGVYGAELAALRRRLRQLGDGQAGWLPGAVLEPLADLPHLAELPEPSPGQARAVLGQLVVVKLNGGLGTSMGLSGPKSLLEVKPGMSFLDVLAKQVLALRERHGARLPFHDLQVHQYFARSLLLAAKLIAFQVHQAHILRLHEPLGNERWRAKRDSFAHADGDIAAVAIDVRATPKAPPNLADLQLESVDFR